MPDLFGNIKPDVTPTNTVADEYDAQFQWPTINNNINTKPQKENYSSGVNQFYESIPLEENIGQFFQPYGGVKPVDKKLTEFDLYDIPEGRAQAQSTGKLILNSLGQTATEATVGLVEGIGYLFNDDLLKSESGEKDFQNAWTETFGGIKDSINENVFPIYQTHKAQEGDFLDRLSDGTYWASSFPTVASTVSLMIPGMGSAALAGRIGKIVGLGGKELKLLQTIAGATTSRIAENTMEASQRFEQSHQQYLNQGLDDLEARRRAGNEAAKTWKYNSLMLGVDMLQYANILKPFGKFAEASKLGKFVDKAIQPLGEAAEEGYQFLAQEEATQKNPFGKEFFNERFADYLSNPEMQSSMFWGAAGGAVVGGTSKVWEKAANSIENYSSKKLSASSFANKESFDSVNQDLFTDIVSRNYAMDKLDRVSSDIDSFANDYINDEKYTPEEKEEVRTKAQGFKDQIEFIKAADNATQLDEKFRKNPDARKVFVLQQLEAKKTAEDITKLENKVNDYYSKLDTPYQPNRDIKEASHKLMALYAVKGQVKNSKLPKEQKQDLILKITNNIELQKQNIAKLKETKKDYTDQLLPNEPEIISDQIKLETKRFKHDNILQPELLKFAKAPIEEVKQKDEEIKQAKKATSKKVAEEEFDAKQTPEEVSDFVDEAVNTDPEIAASIFGKANKKANEEIPNKGVTPIPNPIEEITVPISPDRWDSGKGLFSKEKNEFAKFIEDKGSSPEIKTLSKIIKQSGSRSVLFQNIVNNSINPEFLQLVNDYFNREDKKTELTKEEEDLIKREAELANNPVDVNVEGEVVQAIPSTSDIRVEELPEVFHINARQYDTIPTDNLKVRKVTGDPLPFSNNFNWDLINKLPIGTTLTARIDPNHTVYVDGVPTKNSEVLPEQQLVSLFTTNNEEVGILFTQPKGKYSSLFPVWRKEVQEKGSKEFKIVQKYKGDIHTLQALENAPAARNTLNDISKSYGEELKLGYTKATNLGLHVEIPNTDLPNIVVANKSKSGQAVIMLPKGNGEFMAYPLVTKTVYQGESDSYENVKLEDNETFKKYLTLLKKLPTSEDLKHDLNEVDDLVSNKLIYYKKNNQGYYLFNPANIDEVSRNILKSIGVSISIKKGQEEGKPYYYNVGVPEELILNLEVQQYPDASNEKALLDFLGNMKLQIDGHKLNTPGYYDTVSKRTKTNLANDPVVNVSFFIQPTSNAKTLVEEGTDTFAQDEVTDLSDLISQAADKTSEINAQQDNIDKVVTTNINNIESTTTEAISSDFEDVPFRLGVKDEVYEPLNKLKEFKWLQTVLPNFEVRDLKTIQDEIYPLLEGLDANVYGAFKRGMIHLSENAKSGTVYHEAFHAVFWTALTPEERQKILKDAEKLYGISDTKLLEEELAENFIKYVESNEVLVPEGNFIQRWFKTLSRWLKTRLFNHSAVDNLYYRINQGKFASLKPNPDIKVTRLSSQMKPSIVEARANTLVANFSAAVDDYIKDKPEYLNQTREQVLKGLDFTSEGYSSPVHYFMKQAADRILNTLNDVRKRRGNDPGFKEWADKMNTFIKSSVIRIDNENVYGIIGTKALRKIADREGFKLTNNKLNYSVGISSEDDIDIEVETEQREGWQVDIKSTSGLVGLSNEVRKELSYLPVYNIVNGVKKFKTDDLGFRVYHDFNSVYATLKRELSDLFTEQRILDKLKELTYTIRPQYQNIYDKLTSELPVDKLFKTKFINDFAKTHAEFKMAVQKKDGKVRIYSSNGNTTINTIIKDWESNFYGKGYINPDGTINFEEIEPIVNKIKSAKTELDQVIIFIKEFDIDVDERLFKSKAFQEGVENFIYLPSDIIGGKNIFETNMSKVKLLAEIQSKYTMDMLESSFRNIEGKTVYSHILPGFVAKQLVNLKLDTQNWLDFYTTDIFYKESPFVKDIIKDKSKLDSLEWCMVDGSKYKNEQEGTSYVDFNDKQFASFGLNMFFNNSSKKLAWYQTPILSDSPEGVFIQMEKLTNTQALDKLYQVALQEKERALDVLNKDSKVKFYKDNYDKFYFLDLTLNDMTDLTESEIKEKIKTSLQDKFDKYWEFLNKNNVFDVSDNLGVTNEIIPAYKPEDKVLTDSQIKGVKEFAKNYFLNQVYASSQIITITTGDPAYYKNITDFYKRAKEIVSPTMQMDTNAVYTTEEGEVITPGETYKTLYTDDVELMGNIAAELFQAYESTGDVFYAQVAAQYGYSNHETKDENGKISNFVKTKDGIFPTKLVNVADAQTFISPRRYRNIAVGFGRWNSQLQNTYNRLVNQEALIPEDYQVIMNPYKPFVFGHIKLGHKVVPVQNKNSEYLLTPQLAKMSPTLQKVLNLMENNHVDSYSFSSVVKVGLNNAVTWEDIQQGKDVSDNIHTLFNSNYGLQQEVPEHYIDSEALFGTQIMKHIIANLDLAGDYNGITGKKLVENYQRLISKNLEESYVKAKEELGLSGSEIDYKKLSEILQKEVVSRGLGDDILEAVQINPLTGKLNLDLANPLHSDRNEKLINSIYKNRVTKQKIKGGSFVQASGIGFMENLNIKFKYDDNGTPTAIEEVECMLPWSSKKHFKPFMDDNGNIDIKKVPEPLLKMIGYRIPTEDKYSMLPLKVVDFLPAQTGGVVMLPMEITTLAGSDFDVDKLYIMMPEFEISKDKEDIRKITDDSLEGRNNKIIDLMWDVLTNENTFKQFIKPGGFAELANTANIIYLVSEKVGTYDEISKWSEDKISKEVDNLIKKQDIDLTSPLSNITMFNRNMTGKKLVGIEANHNANHSILQHTNIELAKPIIINGVPYQSLYQIYNNKQELISNNVAQRLAAVVDNAKDPNAFKVNLNTFTADVDALLTRLGVPIAESFALLKQPVIVELTRLYYLYGGDFNAEQKATKEMAKLLNIPVPNTSIINDIDVSFETLVTQLNKDNAKATEQKDIFVKFLLYKEKAKSVADLVRAMSSMNNGGGPTVADNETLVRKQSEILSDKNLTGVSELFTGDVYPLFKSFNDNGLIKPQQDMIRLFPLGNTNENNVINKLKVQLQQSVSKKNLSAKEINKFNNHILTYIGSKIPFFSYDQKEYILKKFPQEFSKAKENPKASDYRIMNFINFIQDDNLPFGRLEFNNTGAMTPALKDDIKDSFYQLLSSEEPKLREFAEKLVKYAFFKEGFIFGPKTFAHLIPTKFYTETEVGRDINKYWNNVFTDESLGLAEMEINTIISQFIKNNWKNSSYVPIVKNIEGEKDNKVIYDKTEPIAVVATIKDKGLHTGSRFVEFIKVPIVQKFKKTEYVLMQRNVKEEITNKQGLPVKTVYTPVGKLGKSSFLNEVDIFELESMLPENNVTYVKRDVEEIMGTIPDAVVEETESFESEEIVSGFQGYKGGFENAGKGTPEGDGKDKAMRQVADSAIVELASNKPSSSKTTLENLGQPNSDSKIIMLARNGSLAGQPLKAITKEAINSASDYAEFVVGDMPNVDSQFIDYLQEIGAKFTIYHTGNSPRIKVLESGEKGVTLQKEQLKMSQKEQEEQDKLRKECKPRGGKIE
jgi:hypothetical protein